MAKSIFARLRKDRAGEASMGYAPDEAEREALHELAKRYDAEGGEDDRYINHREWWQNVAMFAGHQWLRWDDVSNTLTQDRVPSWRVRHIANLIMPRVLSAVQRVYGDVPPVRVPPRGADQRSRDAAQLGELFLRWFDEAHGAAEKRIEAGMVAAICGTSFLKLVFDPTMGEEVQTNVPGARGKTGDFRLEVALPFQIHIPSRATRLQDFPWIVQETWRPIDYVRSRWPEKASFVTPTAEVNGRNFYEDFLRHLLGPSGYAGTEAAEVEPDQVRLVEMWLRPFWSTGTDGKALREHKQGMRILVASGVVLEVGENPYVELGIGLPFFDYHWVQIPGRFWGTSLVAQLTPVQRAYNTRRSKQQEHVNLMTAGKWLVPVGHGIPASSITSEPGEVIEYAPQLPRPVRDTPPPLPVDVDKDIALCRQELADISAQQDATQAKAPGSVRSGLGIGLLQQQDTLVISPIKLKTWHSDLRMAKATLIMGQKLFQAPRLLQIAGAGGEWILQEFIGSDLLGHTDVRLAIDPGAMSTAIVRKNEILDFVELGVLDPANPDHQAAILRGLELQDVRDVVWERTIDEKAADEENKAFAAMAGLEGVAGFVPPVDPLDAHDIHLRRHRLFVLSPVGRRLSPAAREAVMQHVDLHQQALQAKMAQEQQAIEASKGAAQSKGEPSKPKRQSDGQAS